MTTQNSLRRALAVAAIAIGAPYVVALGIVTVVSTLGGDARSAMSLLAISGPTAALGILAAWPLMRRVTTRQQIYWRALSASVIGVVGAAIAVVLIDAVPRSSVASALLGFVPVTAIASVLFIGGGGPLWIGAGAIAAAKTARITHAPLLRPHGTAVLISGAAAAIIGVMLAWIPGPDSGVCPGSDPQRGPTDQTWHGIPLGWGCYPSDVTAVPSALIACGIGAVALGVAIMIDSRTRSTVRDTPASEPATPPAR
ncbi:hypothetical protein [Microbacterium amylolyticum]|uniref:Uncharacterized protein n=1 Tax=Microbacterium amylolyticum TaxID=936337 RepID=A0ABS4ZH04_9MICO|nr:hypothetical protein [Microbacterium amylolyticum]MBP2436569.1 hypothetical protein [Microbacterium amylolyticum]